MVEAVLTLESSPGIALEFRTVVGEHKPRAQRNSQAQARSNASATAAAVQPRVGTISNARVQWSTMMTMRSKPSVRVDWQLSAVKLIDELARIGAMLASAALCRARAGRRAVGAYQRVMSLRMSGQ